MAISITLASMSSDQSNWLKYEAKLLIKESIKCNLDEIVPWLTNNIGESYVDWDIILSGSIIFRFKNEEDKVKFILRWI